LRRSRAEEWSEGGGGGNGGRRRSEVFELLRRSLEHGERISVARKQSWLRLAQKTGCEKLRK